MEYKSHIWAGASKSILKLFDRVQERGKVLINDCRVSNSFDSLEHRSNVARVSLLYRYCNGRCFREIRAWFQIITYFYLVLVLLAEHILLWLIVQ